MTWGADYSTAPGQHRTPMEGGLPRQARGPQLVEGLPGGHRLPSLMFGDLLPGEKACARTCSGCTVHGRVGTQLPLTAQCAQARWIQQADLRHLRSHLYPRLPLPSALVSPPPAHSLANASTPYSAPALSPDNAGRSLCQQGSSALLLTTKASAQLACS